jgi:hypothetical protein
MVLQKQQMATVVREVLAAAVVAQVVQELMAAWAGMVLFIYIIKEVTNG